MDATTRVILLYINVGLKVLSARLMTLLALFLVFSLFAWVMATPDIQRIVIAGLFAVLVFLPLILLDNATRKDRAAITPKEGE